MIKNILFFVIVFLFISNKNIAQKFIETNIISGIITNNKGLPLENIIVSLKNKKIHLIFINLVTLVIIFVLKTIL